LAGVGFPALTGFLLVCVFSCPSKEMVFGSQTGFPSLGLWAGFAVLWRCMFFCGGFAGFLDSAYFSTMWISGLQV